MRSFTVMAVVGTRPEAIKMAPLIRRLHTRPEIRTVVCVTAQHRDMLDQVLDVFAIQPDHDLGVMTADQGLAELSCVILTRLDAVVSAEQPDLLLVQGDTTTTFVSSLTAFYHRVPVAHVEAGLRTYQRYAPLPEEMNRRLTTQLATLHFAPTARNREALIREGIPAADIVVTGNTVIDALHWVVRTKGLTAALPEGPRRLLVTTHRRETWGPPLECICLALSDILTAWPDVEVVLPLHLNPNVRQTVERILGDHDRVLLREPLDYLSFIEQLATCYLVLTDSGGIQEEAPVLGKPVLVLRDETERQEAVDAGTARVVGTSREEIVRECDRLLADTLAYDAMARATNPYGHGDASARIVEAILDRFPVDRAVATTASAGQTSSSERRRTS